MWLNSGVFVFSADRWSGISSKCFEIFIATEVCLLVASLLLMLIEVFEMLP